ncbi:hypothetical protein C2E23DRAFT_845853 [Lenzites betulinus]|nr:hypothetical protein C2E23DRAFT_845853 [Lenzites betulinus]
MNVPEQIPQSHYWDLASVAAIIINNSGIYNRRRLEYSVYGIWNAALNRIALDLSLLPQFTFPFIVIPQYGIYRNITDASPPGSFLFNADHDANTSSQTEADQTARGVSVDFGLAFPCYMGVRDSERTVRVDLLWRRISAFFWPTRNLQLLYLLLPILVELKRAPTRHPETAQEFVNDLASLIEEAQTQGRYQAHCLFSNVRYGRQKKVIHIAGSGEYWSWREFTRSHFAEEKAVFNFNRYLEWMSDQKAVDDDQNAASDLDNPDDAIEDELVAPETAAGTLASRLKEAANAASTRTRSARAARRAETRDAHQQAAQTPPDPNVNAPMFSDDILNAAAFSVKVAQLKISHPFMQNIDEPEQRDVSKSVSNYYGYSGVMRLGTPVSDKHIAIIVGMVATEASIVLQDIGA